MAVAPPTIIDHPSKHRVSRNGEDVVAIVMHGTAGTNSLAYLTENARQVSTNYLIPRDGLRIYRMVSESDGANHAGAPTSTFSLNGKTYKGGAVNRVTIGIELESPQTGRDDYTDPQLLCMGWLLNDIRSRRGDLPILRHGDIDPTRRRDPVNLTHDQIEKWANAAVLVYTPNGPPPPPPAPTIVLWQIVAPCVPLTGRSGDAPLADTDALAPGDVVQGEATAIGGWRWISDKATTRPGIGFVPASYTRPV